MKLSFINLFQMACALTQGFSLDCIDANGGIKEVYFTELNSIASITEASGVVTAITKATGKRFYKYQLPKETAGFSDTWTVSPDNYTSFSAQTLNIILIRLSANKRNEIMLLGRNFLVAVVVDNMGTAWLLGRTLGITMTSGKGEGGVKLGDRNGYTLDFAGSEPEMAPTVTTALLTGLETPG
jgi:hypothetical protein